MSSNSITVPQFASALSLRDNCLAALGEVCESVRAQMKFRADLAVVFFSADHVDAADTIAARIHDVFGVENVLGCSGESIVGVGKEVETSPALSLWMARLPGVDITPMHLRFERTPEGGVIDGWPDGYESEWSANTSLLALGDPFTFPADMLLERLNEDRPGVRVVGGMASAASRPGDNRLILGRRVFHDGAVVAKLSGDLHMRTVVSQGCRPIGKPMVITKSERNIVYELGGKPALLQLKELFDTLPAREQQLVQRGLHLGRVVSEYREQFQPGDFLIRNVIGIDPDAGAIAVGDFFRPGQTVQFHIRDHDTATDDLRQMLINARKAAQAEPGGALLFTCNGRGTRLFGEPHHDATRVGEVLGAIPLAGFFAAGEMGPVGKENFLHGFTASLAIFETPQKS